MVRYPSMQVNGGELGLYYVPLRCSVKERADADMAVTSPDEATYGNSGDSK